LTQAHPFIWKGNGDLYGFIFLGGLVFFETSSRIEQEDHFVFVSLIAGDMIRLALG
jgi:hypothetical protein